MDSASNNDYTWGWRGPSVTVAQIEDWYQRIVAAFHKAATLFIPKVQSSALKFWWDEALDELKKASMLSHQLWVDAGKPRNGTIFQKRTRDKLAYRALIKERKESEKSSISNELHDLLLNKNTNSF